MKTDCISNSTLRIILQPESPIEKLFLETMAGETEKGVSTTLARMKSEVEEYILEIGKK